MNRIRVILYFHFFFLYIYIYIYIYILQVFKNGGWFSCQFEHLILLEQSSYMWSGSLWLHLPYVVNTLWYPYFWHLNHLNDVRMYCSTLLRRQAAFVLILLYGGTTWTLMKYMEKKLDSNYTRMLRVILIKSWRKHPTKQQLYGYLPPITKTIQIKWTRHVGHCWRCKDELISDILLWNPSHRRAKVEWLARIYIQQLCTDMEYSLKDLPRAMDDRDGWQERVREIHAGSATWRWW